MFPLGYLTELLFLKMIEPVGQCAFGPAAQNKIDKLKPSHAHLAFFPIVCDVMNSRLWRKLRVAEP